MRLLDNARHSLHDDLLPDDSQAQTFGSFLAALGALRAVGAVSDEEAHDWTNRMLVALGREPLEPLPQVPGAVMSRAIFLGPGEPPTPPPEPPLAHFIRLVPAPGEAQDIGFGGRVQVLGVELYDTKLAVTWRLAPLPDPEAQFSSELLAHDADTAGLPEQERHILRQQLVGRLQHTAQRLQLTDNVGTTYQRSGGGGGGSGDERVGRTEFTPAVPEAARILTARWGDVAFEVMID